MAGLTGAVCGVVIYLSSKIAHQLAGVGVQGALEGAATAAGAIGLFGAAKGIRGMIGGSKAVGKQGWHQGKGFVEGIKGVDKSQREGGRIGHLAGEAETSPAETANDAVDAKPQEDGTATEKPQVKTVSEMEKAVKARITAVANEKRHSAKKDGASTADEVAKTQKRQKK
ncbi:MAG: hypothetical protein ACR5LC_08130 [Symbiopectobacterium sp.]|uniref:hypothetical protein n=1 Tax=Symbiopectobacterium sp. TaxID=2952789 RepID=UPI003F2D76B8